MKSRFLTMFLTGLALALGLLLAVQITQNFGKKEVEDGPEIDTDNIPGLDFHRTVAPVIFRTAFKENDNLHLTGVSAPSAEISVQNRGRDIYKIMADEDGVWAATIPVLQDDVMVIELVASVESVARIRSDETLIWVPAPSDDMNGDLLFQRQGLIMRTIPGGPSRIYQSPFSGLPTSGFLTFGPIEYDDSGGAIFSGTSEKAGIVRIYANKVLIGQTQVDRDGRWFLLGAETLPTGTYPVSAELIVDDKVLSEVSVYFERMALRDSISDELDVRVAYSRFQWQIVRDLYGGGRQYTAVFAPEGTETPAP